MDRRKVCSICESSSGEIVFEMAYDSDAMLSYFSDQFIGEVDIEHLSGEHFSIRYCGDCDFYWHDNILDEEGLVILYDEWLSAETHISRRDVWSHHEHHVKRASSIRSYFDKPPGDVKVLDYGMGWGSFLLAANAFGCDVYGYDLAPERREYVANRGIEVYESYEGIMENDYDLIHLNQVLEHVADPNEVMELISNSLDSEGICYIEVPAAREQPTEKNVLKQGSYKPLQHINTFTRNSLKKLGDKHGLSLTYVPQSLVQWVPLHLDEIVKNLLIQTGAIKLLERFRDHHTGCFFIQS